MSDIEIHRHVMIHGKRGYLKNAIKHENFNILDLYILKHNEYSKRKAKVYLEGEETEIKPSLFGTQVQRKRWLKNTFRGHSASSLLSYFYSYVIRLGFLDGRLGMIYCIFKGIQVFHRKAKKYELLIERHQSKKTPKSLLHQEGI